MKVKIPRNGNGGPAPASIVAIAVEAVERDAKTTTGWDRFKAWLDRAKLVQVCAALVGGALIYLGTLVWDASRKVDALATRPLVRSAIAEHAAQPAHGIEPLDRRLVVVESKLDLLLAHFGLVPALPAERTDP